MSTAGIVAEYNPFHTGHAYQVSQTRLALGGGSAVVAVMSGNWVQQAQCAVSDKWLRARLALMGGVDLVLELPTVWATASAEGFAQGAAALLEASGVVDTLSFGSECGDLRPLQQVAACLDSPLYQAGLRRFLEEGMPFASCRQAVVRGLLGEELSSLLAQPNNNLGVEYLRALKKLNSGIRPMTIPRRGAAHNSLVEACPSPSGSASEAAPQFVSATQIRLFLAEGSWDRSQPYLVPGARALLEEAVKPGLPSLARVERALLARVRTMAAADWALLPDSGQAEGLPQRLEEAGRRACSMEEFYALAKTRRYTHARLRRLVLWAFLGLTGADIPSRPPYLRVLAFNRRGRELLHEMKLRASLPILTKPAHAKQLDEAGRRLFQLEARCTDLFALCRPAVSPCALEWTRGPVVWDSGS